MAVITGKINADPLNGTSKADNITGLAGDDIINAGSGRNSATEDKYPQAILPRTFDFGMKTGLFLKDVRLCIAEAEALGVPMVVGEAVRQMFTLTQARYGAGSDFTEIAKVVEEWTTPS